MKAQITENVGVANDLVILEIMDAVEEIIDNQPHRPFAFGLATAMEPEPSAPGVTSKILYVGKSAFETLKVLSSLHRSYNLRQNFKNLGLKNLAKIGTQGAAIVLYLLSKQ